MLAPPPAAPARPAESTGERVLAAVAHAAIIFGFLGIGFLVTLGINLVIWLVFGMAWWHVLGYW